MTLYTLHVCNCNIFSPIMFLLFLLFHRKFLPCLDLGQGHHVLLFTLNYSLLYYYTFFFFLLFFNSDVIRIYFLSILRRLHFKWFFFWRKIFHVVYNKNIWSMHNKWCNKRNMNPSLDKQKNFLLLFQLLTDIWWFIEQTL